MRTRGGYRGSSTARAIANDGDGDESMVEVEEQQSERKETEMRTYTRRLARAEDRPKTSNHPGHHGGRRRQ